jgi:hypothetical protein
LLTVAHESSWLLKHGYDLGCSERTTELYDNWLRVKGYRYHDGKTNLRRLTQDIIGHYGQDFLELLEAYNSGACTWVKRIIQHSQGFHHPLYHLLLMGFLAGSAERFFIGSNEKTPEYLPFGAPPFPCRNYVCEYHLNDVIEHIDVKKIKSMPKATFKCPHCGFAYRRKRSTPKEKQYFGQISIVDYGWKWEETVTKMLAEGVVPYKIARDLHCDVRTIFTFGVEQGILPPELRMQRKPYVPIDSPQEKPDFDAQRTAYRQRWLDAIAANPAITRNELRMIDSKADQWLRFHDIDWLENNSPASRKSIPSWAGYDDNYLARVENAVDQIRNSPGMPRRISIAAVGRISAITDPYTRLMSDRLPKTKAFVAANIDTLEQWQQRKIIWAVRQMRERGELLTVYKVRHAAAIQDKERKQDGFILGCIESDEPT